MNAEIMGKDKSEEAKATALQKVGIGAGQLYAVLIGSPDMTREIVIRGSAISNSLKDNDLSSESVNFATGRELSFTRERSLPLLTISATVKMTASDLEAPIVKSTNPAVLDSGFRNKVEVSLTCTLGVEDFWGERFEISPGGEEEEQQATDVEVELNHVSEANP